MLFIILFLVAFVMLGGVVLYLSRTIEHGEARFDTSGKQINETNPQQGPARPARWRDRGGTGEDRP